MRGSRPLVILTLLLCCQPTAAWATGKSLLRLGSITQWTDLSYSYLADQNASRSETEHRFEESYTLLGKYVVLGPRLWSGDFKLDLGLDQEWTRGSTRHREELGGEVEYQLNGFLFPRKPLSLNFSADSHTQRRNQLNAPDYDLQTDTYRLTLLLRNRWLPSSITGSLFSAETDGLTIDRRSTTEQLLLKTQNSLGPSQTHLDVRFSRQQSDFSQLIEKNRINAAEYSLGHTLALSKKNSANKLESRFTYLDETNATGSSENDTERLFWSENLSLGLGAALTTGVRYTFTDDERNTVLRRDATRTRATGAFVQHKLFQSLISQINYSEQQQQTTDGRQNDWQTALSLDYGKNLTGIGRMTLGAGGSYGVIDRDFMLSERSAHGIAFEVKEVDNFLPDPDLVTGSVLVYSADRTTLYLEGADYVLTSVGTATELIIPLGSPIAVGQLLSIDYQFRIDPSVRYATRALHGSGSLTLLDNQLQFFGNYARSSQELLAGEASSATLNDSRTLRIGSLYHRDNHMLRLTYNRQDTTTNPYDSVEGFWSFNRNAWFGRWGLQVTDSYVWYATPGQSNETNNLNLSTFFSQRSGQQSWGGKASYMNVTGQSVSRDKLALELQYDIAFGKSLFSLVSGVDWDWGYGNTSRSEKILLRLRRHF